MTFWNRIMNMPEQQTQTAQGAPRAIRHRHSCLASASLATLLWHLWTTAPAAAAPAHALSFDGVNDYVETPTAVIPTTGDFTVECWVACPTAPNSYRELLSQGSAGNAFYIGTDTANNFRVGDTWGGTGVAFPLGGWHHVAVVKSSTNTFLYLDGTNRLARGSAIANPAASVLRFGQQYGSGGEYWPGSLGDVRIWSKALSAAEVSASRSNSLSGAETNLVAAWLFQEGAGTNCTSIGASHVVGTLNNGPLWKTPSSNFALTFDGVDDYVETSTGVIPSSGDFTVAFWAQALTAPSSYREILSQGSSGNALYIGTDPSNNLRLGDSWGPVSPAIPFPVGGWHHFTLVKTASDTIFYLDGTNRLNRGAAIANPAAPTGLRLGRQFSSSGGEYWPGSVDEVAIWSKALSAAEVRASLGQTITGTESNLLAYWSFNDLTCVALGGPNVVGLLVNGPTWTAGVVVAPSNVPPTIVSQPTNVTALVGTAAAMSVSADGSLPLSYQWYWQNHGVLAGATNATLAWSSLADSNAGTYYAVITNLYGVATSSNAAVTVLLPPTIVIQPANVTALAGTAAAMSVSANGSLPLSYQWYWQDHGAMTGATNATLAWSSLAGSNAGSYYVVISNSGGAVTSSNATVIVLLPPSIVSQPANVTALAGSAVAMSVSANGALPLSYQWYWQNHGAMAGATNATLAWSSLAGSNAGAYYVVVSNAYGTATSLRAWVVPLTWQLNGANSMTNLLHTPFTDPGATLTIPVVAVATGAEHSLALKADGTIVGWGNNDLGQTDVPATATNVVALAAGYYRSLALKADGTLVGWGWDDFGQTDVPATATNVVALAVGYYHSLALKADGTIVGWGVNDFGQAHVPDSATNVVALAAGFSHSLALKTDGTIVGWGNNDFGQTDVPATATNVVALAAGSAHSLALKADGTVVGWGANNDDRAHVPASATNVVALAAGYTHSLALKADGTVVAWGITNGDYYFGQTDVPASATNVVALAAGAYHNLALKADGTIVAWGDNDYDQTDVPASVNQINLPIGVTGTVDTGTPGTYLLTYTFTNSSGSVQTTHRTVVVVGIPPAIGSQPQGLLVPEGAAAGFQVAATGTAPLSYQWQREGVDLPDGGNLSGTATTNLTWSATTTNDGGSYTVVITNLYGSVTSRVARLVVSRKTGNNLVVNAGFETGDFSGWDSSGDTYYTIVRDSIWDRHSGTCGAVCCAPDWLGYLSQTLPTQPGAAYRLSFWLENSCYDFNQFFVTWNGTTLFSQANVGYGNWTNRQFQVVATAASTVLQFGFTSDEGYFALDDISVAPILSVRPQVQTTVAADGSLQFSWPPVNTVPPVSYQVQTSTNLSSTNWLNLGSVVPGGPGTLSVTNPVGSAPQRFYRLLLVP